MTGAIPTELGSLSNLVKLVLWGNELTGEIPPELGNLSDLELLSLSENQLTGDDTAGTGQPLEPGKAAGPVGRNELTGEIPP